MLQVIDHHVTSNFTTEFGDLTPRRDGSIGGPSDISSRSGATLSPNSTAGLLGTDYNRAIQSDDVPTFDVFEGSFNFQFSIPNFAGGDRSDKNKGQNYVVITEDEGGSNGPKLFAKPGHQWPFSYSCDHEPPKTSFIRITPVFKDPDVSQEIVIRCPNHMTSASVQEEYHERMSIIQVMRSSAQYVQDDVTKRFCILIPYQTPDEGTTQTTVNCKFVCFSSCSILRRRDCYLLITLEYLNPLSEKFDIIGRQTLQFRSCACPTRDVASRKRKSSANSSKPSRRKVINFSMKPDSSWSAEESSRLAFHGQEYSLRLVPSLIDTAVTSMIEKAIRSESESGEGYRERIEEIKHMEVRIASSINQSMNVSPNIGPISMVMENKYRPNHSSLGNSQRFFSEGRHRSVTEMGEIPDDVFQLVMDHQKQTAYSK